MEKHFVIDKDYKLLLTKQGKQSEHIRGGHNKEIFMLNIATFKRFCLKAGDGTAYQTSGGLIKKDLLVNKNGKIVSKSKSIEGITNNKLDVVNQQRRDRINGDSSCSATGAATGTAAAL